MGGADENHKVLETRRLTVAYGQHVVLRDLDLSVARGEFVGISGPNGGGKTTLLKAVLGLIRPRSGTVCVLGRPAGHPDALRQIGYVPQRLTFSPGFPATVSEVVRTGAWPGTGLWRRLSPERRRAVERALEVCGLAEVANSRASQLSGGMQQRVLLARAMATQPDLLLLDEPLAGVDLPSQVEFRDLLGNLFEGGNMTVVVVLHEYGPFEGLLSRLVVLAEKAVYDGPPPRHLDDAHDHHSFPPGYLSLLKETGADTR